MVITGPNTGGKTVTLKTAGLLCAMAQQRLSDHGTRKQLCLCVRPRYWWTSVTEQSTNRVLSTFSGHIKNITGILKLAGPQTLVLMDELGAGTDPAEGAALAVSVIEALLRSWSEDHGHHALFRAENFCAGYAGRAKRLLRFNVETLRPTYRLSVGVPGKIHAFLISQKLALRRRLSRTPGALSNESSV